MANQLFSPSLFLPSFLLPFPSLFSLLIFSLSLPLPLKFIEVLENLCYSTEHTLGNGGRDGSGMAVWIPGRRQRRILWSESPCKPWAVHMTPLGHTAGQLCHTTQLSYDWKWTLLCSSLRGGEENCGPGFSSQWGSVAPEAQASVSPWQGKAILMST